MSISSNRDDPLTIQLRFISVISTSIISTLFLMLILPDENVFFQLGFYLPNISLLWNYLFEPLLLTTVLFLGPITHNMFMLTKHKTSNLIKSKYNFHGNFILLLFRLIIRFKHKIAKIINTKLMIINQADQSNSEL